LESQTDKLLPESKRFVTGDWTPGWETLMSTKTRWVNTAALAVALVVIGLLLASRPATAEESNTAECTSFINASTTQEWMRDQIKQNRSTFVGVPFGICAYYHR
jgi:hypothetical protein